VRKADNLPPSCAIVTKSGNLNFLEPCGPVQACNGPALPFKILSTLCIKMCCKDITTLLGLVGKDYGFYNNKC